jgi:ATP-binding cassette subfamily C (CFTR/MRP) protein 1
MVDQGVEKEFKELDPVGIVTNTTIHDDPVAENLESSSGDEFEKAEIEKKYPQAIAQSKPDYGRTLSTSTDKTDLSEIKKPEEKKRSRRDRWNPLKVKPPPVPEERGVSREYTASFWSRLTWQWVTPLMAVCDPLQSRHTLC